MKLKPSLLIANIYIMDLDEGMSTEARINFFEFCDKYLQLTPEAKKKFKDMKIHYY